MLTLRRRRWTGPATAGVAAEVDQDRSSDPRCAEIIETLSRWLVQQPGHILLIAAGYVAISALLRVTMPREAPRANAFLVPAALCLAYAAWIASRITNATILSTEVDPILASADTGLIQTYTMNDPDLLALRVVNRDGQGAEVVPSALGPEIRNELNIGLSRVLESGTEYVGRFIYLPSLNQGAVVVAVPLVVPTQDENAAVLGAVEALVSLRTIHQRVSSEAQADVEAFIVDKSGRILIHSEPTISVQQPDFSSLSIVQEFMKASVPVRLTQTYDDSIGGSLRRVIGTGPGGRIRREEVLQAVLQANQTVAATAAPAKQGPGKAA